MKTRKNIVATPVATYTLSDKWIVDTEKEELRCKDSEGSRFVVDESCEFDRPFDPEQFAEGIRERIPNRQVPEWYEADLLISVLVEMQSAKLSDDQRHAVFSYLGVKQEDIPAIIAEALAACDCRSDGR